MSVTIRFCGASRTVTGSCYLFETSVRALPGRLRAVSGTEDPERAELRRLSVSPRRYRCRAADPCPYRPQRPVAQARARRICRPHPGDARHHRSLFLHVARRRQHPGIGSRGAEPAQRRARARRGQPDLYAGRCDRRAAVVFSGRLRKMDRRDSGRSRALLECRASARLGLDRDRMRRWRLARKADAHSRIRRHRTGRQIAAARSRRPCRLRLRHLRIDLWRQGAACDDARCAPRASRRGSPRRRYPQGRAADPGFCGRAHPGAYRRPGGPDGTRRNSCRADLSGFSAGDPRHRGVSQARRKPRSHGRRSPAVELAATAVHRDGR